jgi:hypothetical protein
MADLAVHSVPRIRPAAVVAFVASVERNRWKPRALRSPAVAWRVTRRSVILRHMLPDGSWHRDWLIEPPGDSPFDERSADLVSFRLPPDAPTPGDSGGCFECERLPPHRRLYLSYEGEVSGGRGRVVREAEFAIRWESLGDAAAALWVIASNGRRLWTGRLQPDGRWRWEG